MVKIHSFDYDAAIFYKRSIDNYETSKSPDICVFLDEAATHHSDYSLLGVEVAKPIVYFAAMNRFFDFIDTINTKIDTKTTMFSKYINKLRL